MTTQSDQVRALISKGITDRAEIATLTGLTRKQIGAVFQIDEKKDPKALKGVRFKPSIGLNVRQRQAVGAYKPRAKQESEAGSKSINLMQQPPYEPARHNTNGMVRTL